MSFRRNIWAILLLTIWAIYLEVLADRDTEYSQEEVLALEQFRTMIPDIIAQDQYYEKDSFLIRWLRARKLDLNGAEDMIRKASNWRRENRIDNILNETLLEFSQPPYLFHGTDKEGRPLAFFTPANIDTRALILSGKRELGLRSWDQFLEKGFHYIKYNFTTLKNGKDVTQLVGIFDAHGLNRRQHGCLQCIPAYIEMLNHYELYYPDPLKYLVIINLHRRALPFVELLRPFFSESTQKCLKIFGTTKKEWSSFLKTIIDEDQLPYRFGGKIHR